MIDIVEDLLMRFSLVCSVIYFLRRSLKKVIICMALAAASSNSPPSSWQLGSFYFQVEPSPKRFKRRSFFSSNDEYVTPEAVREIFDVEHESENGVNDSGCIGEIRNKNKGLDINEGERGILRKRPTQLIVPAYCATSEFARERKKLERKEFQEEGKGFSLASKKGRREVMEDGHAVMLDISGNPKQAFFVVIDGHGGRGAADFVADNLGKNILDEVIKINGGKPNQQVEAAIRTGYSTTDTQLLRQGVSGGACAASVLVKDGEMHVANVGDCRVVLSRKGLAMSLTTDHRLERQDERTRIENAGGYLHCRNGVWRVNGSLAVSRAFGDLHLKDYVISEPDIVSLSLTTDCDFLLVASDGLWDKVGEQEAVDVVSKRKNSLESCRELVDICSTRGTLDDVTVMIINLHNFVNPQN